MEQESWELVCGTGSEWGPNGLGFHSSPSSAMTSNHTPLHPSCPCAPVSAHSPPPASACPRGCPARSLRACRARGLAWGSWSRPGPDSPLRLLTFSQEEEESLAEGSRDEPGEQAELRAEGEAPGEGTSAPSPPEPAGGAAPEGEKAADEEDGDKPEAQVGPAGPEVKGPSSACFSSPGPLAVE